MEMNPTAITAGDPYDLTMDMKQRALAAHRFYRMRFNQELGMVAIERGHTTEVSSLGTVHCGRATSEYFLLHDFLGEEPPPRLLEALQSLQITDIADPHYGGFRWYAEETSVHDTNAAFFIQHPLVLAVLGREAQDERPSGTILRTILARGLEGFRREKEHPKLFYTNKVVSDAALLFALEWIVERRRDGDGKEFLETWCEYTEKKGWGWGENTSPVYIQVTLSALCLAMGIATRSGCEDAFVRRLKNLAEILSSSLAFHAPNHFVPSIRSYNFAGEPRCPLPLYALMGYDAVPPVPTTFQEAEKNYWTSMLDWVTRFADFSLPPKEQRSVPAFHRERVWEGTHATSWRGKHIGLGGVEKFPVMRGCYQSERGGLGWQSMPVAFVANDENYGYLQWKNAGRDGKVRTHPAADYHSGYLSGELFASTLLGTDIHTLTRQAGPLMLVARLAWSLPRAEASEMRLSDSLYVPRFSGTCVLKRGALPSGSESATAPCGEWVILNYPGCALAIQAVTVRASDAGAGLDIHREGDALRIERPLSPDWPEAWWLIAGFDHPLTEEQCRTLPLPGLTVSVPWDPEKPRGERQERRCVEASFLDSHCKLEVDPYLLDL